MPLCEVCLCDVCLCDVCLCDVCLCDVCLCDVCLCDVCLCDVCLCDVCLCDVCLFMMCACVICACVSFVPMCDVCGCVQHYRSTSFILYMCRDKESCLPSSLKLKLIPCTCWCVPTTLVNNFTESANQSCMCRLMQLDWVLQGKLIN